MNRTLCALLGAALLVVVSGCTTARAEYRLGFGANYWTAVDDINVDNFDDDGLSYYISYQTRIADLSSLEILIEKFEEGFGGSEHDVYAPQVFLILGSGLYAGVGAGIYHVDGEFLDDPFFAVRAGFNLELLPNIYLDLSANYRFEEWDEVNVNDINEDTITLGAAARIAL